MPAVIFLAAGHLQLQTGKSREERLISLKDATSLVSQ
jgi:hypothetical protein